MPIPASWLSLTMLWLLAGIGSARAQKAEPPFLEHQATVVQAHFSADDDLLITVSADGVAKLWDVKAGHFIRSFGTRQPPIDCIVSDFSPDGKLVAVGTGRSGKVWNTKFGDQVCNLTGYADTIQALHFSNNNKWLITASFDGTAKLWEIESGKRHHSLNHMLESLGTNGNQAGITDARFCDNDKSLITGTGVLFNKNDDNSHGIDSAVLIWDLKSGKSDISLIGYPFDISPDGQRIVTGSQTTRTTDARVWDVTGKQLFTLKGHTGKVTSCEFSSNGKWIATAAQDTTAAVWDPQTGRLVHRFALTAGPGINTVQLSSDGKLMATFSGNGTQVWDLATGKELYLVPSVKPITFSHDGSRILVLTGNHSTLCDSRTGTPIQLKGEKGKKVKVQ